MAAWRDSTLPESAMSRILLLLAAPTAQPKMYSEDYAGKPAVQAMIRKATGK